MMQQQQLHLLAGEEILGLLVQVSSAPIVKTKNKVIPTRQTDIQIACKGKLSTANDDDDVRMWGETNYFFASQSSFLKTTQNPNQHIMDTMKKTQTGVVTTKAWELQNTQQQNYFQPKNFPKTHTHTHT